MRRVGPNPPPPSNRGDTLALVFICICVGIYWKGVGWDADLAQGLADAAGYGAL